MEFGSNFLPIKSYIFLAQVQKNGKNRPFRDFAILAEKDSAVWALLPVPGRSARGLQTAESRRGVQKEKKFFSKKIFRKSRKNRESRIAKSRIAIFFREIAIFSKNREKGQIHHF